MTAVFIGGFIIYILLVIEILGGSKKLIKLPYKNHKILGIVILLFAAGHAVYGFILWGQITSGFIVGFVLVLLLLVSIYTGIKPKKLGIKGHRFLAALTIIAGTVHVLFGLSSLIG
ncbi:MAG: hypothetical protein K9K78_04895 [Spirochaetales bacterium]|nr:hypothetical protein [Spirochaetales bacterium]